MILAQSTPMIPDVGALGSVAGWATAVFVVVTGGAILLRAFLKGDLVPGSVAKAQAAEIKELRELVKADVLPQVKEIGEGTKTLVIGMTFLTDFVKDVARREGRDRERRDDP